MGRESFVDYHESLAFSLWPEEYLGLVKTVSRNNMVSMVDDLHGIPITNDTAVVVVGSDGKQEAHARSKPEIAIWDKSGSISPHVVMDWYNKSHPDSYGHNYDLGINGLPEVKDLLHNPLASVTSFGSQGCNIYPDRAINAGFVLGNHELYREGRIQALELISADSEDGRRIRKELRRQLNTYQAALDSGRFNKKMMVDFDSEQQLYDCDHMVTGFKTPVLRLIQRSLDLVTAYNLKKDRLTLQEAEQLSTNTLEKIEALLEKGILPRELSGLFDAYGWFLQEYHFAQELNQNTNSMVRVHFDQEFYRYFTPLLNNLIKETKVCVDS